MLRDPFCIVFIGSSRAVFKWFLQVQVGDTKCIVTMYLITPKFKSSSLSLMMESLWTMLDDIRLAVLH